jgi:hypothetical protein
MRRFTRLTNGFSKKSENHRAAVGLHFCADASHLAHDAGHGRERQFSAMVARGIGRSYF